MAVGDLYKIVYEDSGEIKAVKGYLLKEDEHFVWLRMLDTNTEIAFGKRFINKMILKEAAQ